MRRWMSVLLLAALVAAVRAQGPGGGDPAGQPDANKAGPGDPGAPAKVEPKEPPAWVMPDRERRKVASALKDYLHPRKSRQDSLARFDKFATKPVGGHSILEDVTGFMTLANQARLFNPKLASKRGHIQTISIGPDVHGFPGGVGTVKYELFLPKGYSDRSLWPLLFCMPDNSVWPDKKRYIEEVWLKRSPEIAAQYIIAAPHARAKGESWIREGSLARAMISLRHLAGTFDATRKTGGPAVDMLRMFLAGGDAAALTAARFAEMFTGAILRGCDGIAPGGPNLRQAGGISGLPAYCIISPEQRRQKEFAQRIRSANDATLILESEDATLLGDATAIAKWMEKLPARAAAPRSLDYTVHDPSFQRFHWINVLRYDASVKPAPGFIAQADRATNEVRIDVTGISRFEVFLNDAVVDLNRKVRLVILEDDDEYDFFPQGSDFVGRSLATMLDELLASNQPWRIYPAKLIVDMAALRARAEKAAAEKAAKEEQPPGDAGAKGPESKSPPAAPKAAIDKPAK